MQAQGFSGYQRISGFGVYQADTPLHAGPGQAPDYRQYVAGGVRGAAALSREPAVWVGYDSSPYAVSKTLVVATMMRQGAETDAVLQVGVHHC